MAKKNEAQEGGYSKLDGLYTARLENLQNEVALGLRDSMPAKYGGSYEAPPKAEEPEVESRDEE